MLAELRMELETENEELSFYQSSNMQGVLMEQIASNYAEILHEQRLNPYSQYLELGEKKYWIVKTLTKEAYENIIKPLLSEQFRKFDIEKKHIHVKVIKKELMIRDKKELLKNFYEGECNRFLNIEFLTPTAFKSNGSYLILPDLKCIYQSLMNKYSASCEDMDMFDLDTLEDLVNNSSIVHYKLHSTYFALEGIKIPAFKGKLSIKIQGTETMAKYARFLAEFGEYSGVGIKSAIGMGAMKVADWRK